MAKLNFDIFKCPGPARTSAWVLLHSGALAGRIITAWPNQAGGCGYDKESAAFQDALDRHGLVAGDMSWRGMGAVRDWLASAGYELRQVL